MRWYVPSEIQSILSCQHRSDGESVHRLVGNTPEVECGKHGLEFSCSKPQNMNDHNFFFSFFFLEDYRGAISEPSCKFALTVLDEQ